MPASDPVAAAASAARRSPSTSGSTDCVSGSPNRQLYSSTRGPSGVSMRPTNRVPTNGDPRLASSARTGRTVSSTIRATASSSISATGANEPIPPVLGPASPSYARLKSRAGASATASMPSHNANTETSGPSRSSSTRTSPSNPSATASPARSSSSVRQTITPFPAARPSAFSTHGARGSASSAAVGTPATAITAFANRFDPSMRAAAADGPNTGIPECRRTSATPATSGASGPTTTRSMSSERASPSSPSASSAATG